MNMKQYSADKHLMKKDFRAALQNYLEIIQDDPNNGIAHQGVAQCYFALKDHINAASASKKAIELDRSLAIPYAILAKIHIRQQDFDKALAEASRAYELSPDLEEVANLYGVLLLSNGRLDESILVLRQVSELHPESVRTHRNLAVTYREKRDFKKNVDEMRLVLRYEPTFDPCLRPRACGVGGRRHAQRSVDPAPGPAVRGPTRLDALGAGRMVAPAALGTDAGILGVACLAEQQFGPETDRGTTAIA